MPLRVAINGFGRIGRQVLRIAKNRHEFDFVAINDLAEPAALAHLFRFDSVHGRFDGAVALEGQDLIVDGDRIQILAEKDPALLPWKAMEVDIVVESTGIFRKRAQLEKHLQAGAKRVVLSAPAKDAVDAVVVLGVNEGSLKGNETVVSLASCTTNCVAPILHILRRRWGMKIAHLSTVHAYTNDQNLLDLPHSDLRRARAAALNITPTTTGAASALRMVLPDFDVKMTGVAFRVPVPSGSLVDLVAELERPATVEEVNAEVRRAASEEMKGIVEYSDLPLVSTDILGNPHSSVFDSLLTAMAGDRSLKVVCWYDNEWGYASRMVDLLERVGSLLK